MDKSFRHSWTQPYGGTGKYQRLYHLSQLIRIHDQFVIWDRMEPITDVTEAAALLRQFSKTPPDPA
jgi:hypothetical protein